MNKEVWEDLKNQWEEGKVKASPTMILAYRIDALIESLKEKE